MIEKGLGGFGGENRAVVHIWQVRLTGDVDGNGTLELKDLIRSLQVLAAQEGGSLNMNADVDSDLRVGLAEAIYVIRQLSK